MKGKRRNQFIVSTAVLIAAAIAGVLSWILFQRAAITIVTVSSIFFIKGTCDVFTDNLPYPRLQGAVSGFAFFIGYVILMALIRK